MAKISVQLVDDHSVLRAGVRRLLEGEGDMEVVAESGSATQGVQDFRRHHPDVVVMDISLGDRSGLDASEEILAIDPAAHILVLSMHEHELYPSRAIKSGVTGFVTKSSRPEELIEAVRCTAHGEKYLESRVARSMALRPLSGEGRPLGELTEREYEVFLLLAQGRSVRQIAETLFLSPKTVGTHRAHILQKLRVPNIVELSRIAIRYGLVEA